MPTTLLLNTKLDLTPIRVRTSIATRPRLYETMFSFDLKSAYHQIKVSRNFIKYLGFVIEEEDGRKHYFQYLSLPFGLNDAMRVFKKMMKSPLEK